MTIANVFLSYSRSDGAAFALRLTADLKKEGFDVWIDQEDIVAGRKWDLEIEKALESCDCLLFIETENAVKSPNVLDEVYYALEQNKKVIPLIFVDSKTPYRLQRFQHIDFTINYHAGLQLLIKELQVGTDKTYAYAHSNDETHTTAPVKTKNKLLWVLVPLLIAVALAVTVFINRPSSNETIAKVDEQATPPAILQTDTIANTIVSIEEKNEPAVDKNSNSNTTTNSQNIKAVPGKQENPINKVAERITITAEMLEGNWKLSSVAPTAKISQGYLKVTPVPGGQISIKSYVQFNYPKTDETLFLSIFNAFSNCSSCATTGNIKMTVEDVSIASQYYQVIETQTQQGSPPKKDTIKSVGSNKSIRAKATLRFLDQKRAELKIERPDAVEVGNGMIMQPFTYSFLFNKPDY